ncbi:TetR/AcrR family transcriptional regulator [Mycobacterium sp. OTB74]|uniref:TetR/AcrR family transcriptional regulator n=1 Tax=Mycobacterium sp. OTB74 TaxID=1853452 RepID=UPI00247503D9|nr:TetR/AcrR family transcriptional regulator [Mycobacterium sp. OTB74]MDH6243638.1 AcrR family transcriptional regulator [Mycobacterium sp. OTB74]
MARTQQQRREETRTRLLDAAIDTIVEVGYARASAKVIAQRAQVSDGALFKHFATMGDFMSEVTREVMRRQLDAFNKQVAEIPSDKPALEGALVALRDVSGNATNTVLHELRVAARTDEKLRTTLQGALIEYSSNIYETAQAMPGADQLPAEHLAMLVTILINVFDGAGLMRAALPQPELEDGRIQLLLAMLSGLAPAAQD